MFGVYAGLLRPRLAVAVHYGAQRNSPIKLALHVDKRMHIVNALSIDVLKCFHARVLCSLTRSARGSEVRRQQPIGGEQVVSLLHNNSIKVRFDHNRML